jgi:hypothetical protein
MTGLNTSIFKQYFPSSEDPVRPKEELEGAALEPGLTTRHAAKWGRKCNKGIGVVYDVVYDEMLLETRGSNEKFHICPTYFTRSMPFLVPNSYFLLSSFDGVHWKRRVGRPQICRSHGSQFTTH